MLLFLFLLLDVLLGSGGVVVVAVGGGVAHNSRYLWLLHPVRLRGTAGATRIHFIAASPAPLARPSGVML